MCVGVWPRKCGDGVARVARFRVRQVLDLVSSTSGRMLTGYLGCRFSGVNSDCRLINA